MNDREDTKSPIHEAVSAYTPPPAPKGKLRNVAAKRALPTPVHENPQDELRRLARQHSNWSRTAVAWEHQRKDRKNHETGEAILCRLPESARLDLEVAEKRLREADDDLVKEMVRALKKTRIWTEWLSGVAGAGEKTMAPIVGEIDIRVAVKAGSLKMFCGVVPDLRTGRLVRRTAGEKNRWNGALRTCIYLAMTSIWKNGAQFTVCEDHKSERPKATASAESKAEFRAITLACRDCRQTAYPYGRTCKYLGVWQNAKYGRLHDPRFNESANTWTRVRPDGSQDVMKGGRMQIHKTGLWKAADIFVEDLYTVWRAIEGLPVWPDWYAAKLGYMHGGKICVREPKMMTVEEAIAAVGDTAWRPRAAPMAVEDAEDASEAAE